MKVSYLIVGVIALIAMTATASAITVDNDISDWGGNLGTFTEDNWNTEDPWVPGDGVYFVVENDNSSVCENDHYTESGVHIKGVGSNWNPWTEQPVNGYCPPSGGERWDVEALYVKDDNNNNNISILAIVSIGPNGYYESGYGWLYICCLLYTSPSPRD